MTAPPSLASRAAGRRDWLFQKALPLWWERGADHAGGGFHERLSMAGEPVPDTRRVRVTARQVYSYATAGRIGWHGPWRDAVEHGLAYLLGPCARPDGTIAHRIDAAGRIVDEGPDIYDQAFLLLALAHAYGALGDAALRDRAHAVLDVLRRDFAHPDAGFEEARPRRLPLRANPHMHMLEVALAWRDVDDDPRWHELAQEMVTLCRTRFLARDSGTLREFFDGDWRPAGGEADRILEPGHHFEWAWLLHLWSRGSGENLYEISDRLVEIGERYGVDPGRGVAVDGIRSDFTTMTPTSRLWPQVERLKAALAAAPAERDAARERREARAHAACDALDRYLATPLPGLWRDRMLPDGRFVEEPAPASTLYHLVCAQAELSAYAQAREAAAGA